MDALDGLLKRAHAAVGDAGSLRALEDVRVRFLGRKGEITALLKGLGALPPEQRPAAGQAINFVRDALNEAIESRRASLERDQLESALAALAN